MKHKLFTQDRPQPRRWETWLRRSIFRRHSFVTQRAVPPERSYVYPRVESHTIAARSRPAASGGRRSESGFRLGYGCGRAIFQTLPTNSHVVLPDDAYYGVRLTARDFLPKWGIQSCKGESGDASGNEIGVDRNSVQSANENCGPLEDH